MNPGDELSKFLWMLPWQLHKRVPCCYERIHYVLFFVSQAIPVEDRKSVV
jgi:hypothetical protein